MKTIYLTLLAVIFSTVNLYSQASMQWSFIYDNANVRDNVEQTVVDNQGTVFLAGFKSMYSTSYIPQPFIAKISTGGNIEYTRTFTHPFGTHPFSRGIYFRSAAPDNQGNVVAAGYIDSGAGNCMGIVVKYNSVGDTMWARYLGIVDTNKYCAIMDVKIDNSGNIYVTGANYYWSSPSFQGFITVKYNSNGALQWAKRYTPPAAYSSFSYCYLVIDNAGNINVVGTFQKTSSSNSSDVQVMKYTSSGTLLWATGFNGIGDDNDVAKGLAVDGSGNVYAAATTTNINANVEAGCIKFNSATGSMEWSFRVDGSSNSYVDQAGTIAINTNNEIYFSSTIGISAYEEAVLVKLNTAGAEQWRRTEPGNNNDKGVEVKADNTGAYALVGVTVNATPYVKVRKYSPAGDTIWSTSYHVNGRGEKAQHIVLGPSNNLYIAGGESWTNNIDYVYLVRYTHSLTGVSNISNEIPEGFSLKQNYPNPFNPVTNINFSIPKSGFVKITVFDITGKEVAKLVNEQLSAGTYNADFNASSLSSGAYFYRLETEGFTDIKKMILVK